jgi:hypothetical protein
VFYYVLSFLIVYEMHPCKLQTFVDRLEIDFLRRFLKETIDSCEIGENEDDEQDYFNTEDVEYFFQNTSLFPGKHKELIVNYRKYLSG